MAWLGVPFATEAAWKGFDWTNLDFLNQFIEAGELRVNALLENRGHSTVTLSRLVEGVNVQSAPQWNALRNLGNYWYTAASGGSRNAAYADVGPTPLINAYDPSGTAPATAGHWIDGALLAVGQLWEGTAGSVGNADNARFFDSPGLATTKLLLKMNEILDAAGCDSISTTPTASGPAMGMPWTRKSGDNGSPTIGTGAAQPGDIMGRHFFNEWWAFLMALDAIFDRRTIAVMNNGSEVDVSSVGYYGVTSDPCGYLANLANGSTVNTNLVEARTSVDLTAVRWLPASLSDATSGESSAVLSTLIFTSPDLTHGEKFVVFAIRSTTLPEFAGYTRAYQDFLGTGAAEEEIIDLVEIDDDGTDATLAVGTTANLMPAIDASCAYPGGTEVKEHFCQRLITGFAAVKFAFPDP